MRKIIVSVFLVLTIFSFPAVSITAKDWFDNADALWNEKEGKFTDPRDAVRCLNNAIKLQPKYAGAYVSRGNAYADLGQYQRAVKDYTQAIIIKPDYAYAYINRSDAYYNLGRYRLAVEDSAQAIRLKPDEAVAYSNRGKAYAKLGQYQPAINDFNEAVRLKPDYVNAYNNRALVYILQGNNDLGCRDAQKTCAMGLCKVLEWAKQKRCCLQQPVGKPGGDAVKLFKTNAPVNKIPEKQVPAEKENKKSSVAVNQPYKGIKGIVLMNGNRIEGQIINMNTDTVTIRTRDGKILSYDFNKEIMNFINE